MVCDGNTECELLKKLETVTFKNEKVALGIKAFRAMRATPEQIAEDPLLKELGKDAPRLILFDANSKKSEVFEGKKMTATKLFKGMRKVAKRYFKEDLEKVVKKHLKLLETQDKLVKQGNLLREKEQKLDAKERAGSKGKKIKKEMEELTAETKELKDDLKEIWKLTSKVKA